MISDSGSSDFSSDFTDKMQNGLVAGFTENNICGESASCIVYQMRIDGLRVAVKRLRPEFRTNPIYVAAFRKEYMIGRQLKHDSLPVYRDFRADLDEVYIVMEYVDGVSLDKFVLTESGKEYFSYEDNVRRFLTELVGVVGYLHRSGVIHCDLKPANIILRNSNRGVMLIDLDKAYSDTLDLTHGGTTNVSEPLPFGEKPTVWKDYRAIGRIIDCLSGNVSRFPLTKFRKFRDSCLEDGINVDRLQKNLKPSSGIRWWLIAIISVLLLVGLIIAIFKRPSETVASEAIELAKDTVMVQLPITEENQREVFETKSSVPIIDPDDRMTAFIYKIDSVTSLLETGKLSDSEIRSLTLGLAGEYASEYGKILADLKKENPAMSGLDIELALAKSSEHSRALGLLNRFTQAAADTLRMHKPEIY